MSIKREVIHPLDPYLRTERFPHIWCPGCGIGVVIGAFLRGWLETNIPREKLVVVSGIGCTSRAPGYLLFDTFHATHGRGIPFATGLKIANPDLTVVVIAGDGDLFSIGGNHFIHAARRNVDLTIICVNNFNYGMTGGQMAPTTPMDSKTTTSPYGNIEQPFNLVHLAVSAGAVYVARWTTYHVRQLQRAIKEALLKKGFSFVEVLSQCPINFGRRNQWPDSVSMLKYFKEHSQIRKDEPPEAAEITIGNKIIVGKFVDTERETFMDKYHRLVQCVTK